MPCNSDYMNPTHKEAQLQQTAKLLAFLLQQCNLPVTKEVKDAAADAYCRWDFTAELCARIHALSSGRLNAVVYNGRNSMSRQLADWWEKHQAADAERLAEEARRNRVPLEATHVFKAGARTATYKIKIDPETLDPIEVVKHTR